MSVGETSPPYISLSAYLACSSARIHRDDFVVEPIPSTLALGDNLGLKACIAVSRNQNLRLAKIALQFLGAATVASIIRARRPLLMLLVAKMVVQLAFIAASIRLLTKSLRIPPSPTFFSALAGYEGL
jgi:hypothetical protein